MNIPKNIIWKIPNATGSQKKRPNESRPSTTCELLAEQDEESSASDPQPASASDIPTSEKRRKRALSGTEKQMVYNVYKHVYEDKKRAVASALKCTSTGRQNPADEPKKLNKDKIVAKAAEMLGIAKASVYRVLKEHKENASFSSPSKPGPKLTFKDKIDKDTFKAIRQKVIGVLSETESPSVEKVLQKVNEDPDLPNFSLSTMRRVLKHLNIRRKSRTWLAEEAVS